MQQEVEFLRFISSFKYLHWYNNKNLTIIITFVSLCCCIPAWRSWYRSWWTWGVSSSWWEDWSSCRTSILISPFFDLPPPSWWVEYWNLVRHTKLFTSHLETDKAECRSPFSALHSPPWPIFHLGTLWKSSFFHEWVLIHLWHLQDICKLKPTAGGNGTSCNL